MLYTMQMLYPWFLMGLIAIAIPIIIHLLQLRRPQRVVFTNNSFIREVELVAVRHRKVHQLLILQIGNCFFAASSFRENCFYAGFTLLQLAPR